MGSGSTKKGARTQTRGPRKPSRGRDAESETKGMLRSGPAGGSETGVPGGGPPGARAQGHQHEHTDLTKCSLGIRVSKGRQGDGVEGVSASEAAMRRSLRVSSRNEVAAGVKERSNVVRVGFRKIT